MASRTDCADNEAATQVAATRQGGAVSDIEAAGPVRGDWPDYSKLAAGEHHCHLKKGQPTYVAVWRESKGTIRLVEIVYAGTHEKAPC